MIICCDTFVHDIRYAGENNLIGERLDGYHANKLYGTEALFKALEKARNMAKRMGLDMVVYDAYRPQKAVAHLMRWAMQPGDQTKAAYYPRVLKHELIPLGYIAEKSGHSRGSTVDLTLTRDGMPLDMGTDFDFMDDLSHHLAKGLTDAQTANRQLLKSTMEACGFAAYECEWWHYRLQNEPYPHTYFDIDII